jgi:hypothetical protein
MQVEVSDLKPKDSVRVSFQLPPSGALIDGIVVWQMRLGRKSNSAR